MTLLSRIFKTVYIVVTFLVFSLQDITRLQVTKLLLVVGTVGLWSIAILSYYTMRAKDQ